MSSILNELYSVDDVRSMMRDVDSVTLASSITGAKAEFDGQSIPRLRVASNLLFQEVLSRLEIGEYVNHREIPFLDEGKNNALIKQLFSVWDRYLEALAQSEQSIELDEVFFFAAAGLLAERPTEVRSVLRSNVIRKIVDDNQRKTDESWASRVRRDIAVAVLLLTRQRDENDINIAGQTIERLAIAQRDFENEWLSRVKHSIQRAALSLLSLYHLARATIRTSEYLLSGSVRSVHGEGRAKNFLPELGRLLDRAEEYASNTGDDELKHWMRAAGILLVELRANSIWATAYDTSTLLDNFIEQFPQSTSPIFSLLPSQREALREHLLDSQKLAIVLQMPTSAGKTLLAEFSILQTIEAYGRDSRVVYVTPTRALATQVRRTLSIDFANLGIQVSAAGSAFEEDPYELNLLMSAEGVIVATPEKLDLLLRSHPEWLDRLRMVVIDEAHLLKEEGRGTRLELLLANLRREYPQTRLLLLTPFVSNAEQIAAWLAGDRGASITVHWRPSNLLLGLARIKKHEGKSTLSIEWREPQGSGKWTGDAPNATFVNPNKSISKSSNILERATFLAEELQRLGSSLVMFPSSPSYAEKAARIAAESRDDIPKDQSTPELRLAIALARAEYGDDSVLAYCLGKGIAFHHSSLSSELRFLIEDLAKSRIINFIFATTTLAQGMNFPVASVVVHSIHKPYGGGDLTPGEFWNIAGRAGRVGLVDRGLIVFANEMHEEKLNHYAETLTEPLYSALLVVIHEVSNMSSLKEAYRRFPQLRAFFQYLTHSAASLGLKGTIAELEELLHASLASFMAGSAADRRLLRNLAVKYLANIADKNVAYLKTVDTTGLGSFSFDELYARILDDSVLREGPGSIMERRDQGLRHLISALAWLPELDLAIGKGPGNIDVEAVSRVVQLWMSGASIRILSSEFPEYKANPENALRKAGNYVFGTVSQMISWGAHAYLRGWTMAVKSKDVAPEYMMLPTYIQYGVNTPEAAVASHLGIPRQLSEAFGSEYRSNRGNLTPERTRDFKKFLESADLLLWRRVVEHSPMKDSIDPEDVFRVWKTMSGSQL